MLAREELRLSIKSTRTTSGLAWRASWRSLHLCMLLSQSSGTLLPISSVRQLCLGCLLHHVYSIRRLIWIKG